VVAHIMVDLITALQRLRELVVIDEVQQ